MIQLEPASLAVSAERVKQAVLSEFSAADQWRGKIHLVLVPALSPDQPIQIASTLYRDGWQYRMEVPDFVAEPRLVRALVQLVLLEMANRESRSLSAELPLWLSEGLSRHLLANRGPDLLVQTGTLRNPVRTNREQLKPDLFREARQRLQSRSALAFGELSWPAGGQLSGENWEVFQSCAQLFVYELLHLDGGRSSLRRMLRHLPEHFNWQTAFLRAFGRQFQTLLDVEKWWAVTVVNFTGRSQWQTWPAPVAWTRLGEILQVQAQVHSAADQIPERTQLKVQTVIQQWDYGRQKPALRQVIQQLIQLRLNSPPALVPLIDDYRRQLEVYLAGREQSALTSDLRGQPLSHPARLAQEAVKRLDGLDARRHAMKSNSGWEEKSASASPAR